MIHEVQTGNGAHSASYLVGTRDPFHLVRLPERESEHVMPTLRISGATSYISCCILRMSASGPDVSQLLYSQSLIPIS